MIWLPIADEGDRRALSDGDAELVGQKAHDGGVSRPREPVPVRRGVRERDEEEVAPDVGAEDCQQVFPRQLAVAVDLDRGCRVDAETRIVIEKVIDCHPRENKNCDHNQRQKTKDDAPGGSLGQKRRQKALAYRHTLAGAQEYLFALCVIVLLSRSRALWSRAWRSRGTQELVRCFILG